ncbi:hypothetical protein PG984_009474 [Apiospora sp. TS-2023a]
MSVSTSFSGVPGQDPIPSDNVSSASFNTPETCHITQERFNWLLPKSKATEEAIRSHRKIQQTAMIVSNEELAKVLSLEEPVQSWALKSEGLRRVMDYLLRDGKELAEFEARCEVLTKHEDYAKEGNKFTIRYVGTCQRPSRPIDRFEEDLISRTSGILADIQTALDFLFPNISGQVHRLVDAAIDWTCSHNCDGNERVLIEFFDTSTLLNRQLGGFYGSYTPASKETILFENLGTNYYHRALQTSGPHPHFQFNALQTLFNGIQELASATPEDTGTGAHPGQRMKASKDITLEDYLAKKGLMAGQSRASYLTKSLLRHLARHEMERLELDEEEEWIGEFDFHNLFPYYDLWPWLKHVRLDIAVDFLRQYLAIVRPLIVNTYSKPVSSITRANFLHEFGLPRSSFVEHVEELTMQYYASTSNSF